MDGDAFGASLEFVTAHGYFLVFLGMLVEGPIVTAAAAFAASLGYFSLPIIFGLSLLGDILADGLYYILGYLGRVNIVDRLFRRFGLSHERIVHIEELIHEHGVKTLLAIKLAPFIAAPGLMLVGAARFNLKKFASVALAVTVPRSLFFTGLGYYFGSSYGAVEPYIDRVALIALAAIVAIFLYVAYEKISKKISESIEKI